MTDYTTFLDGKRRAYTPAGHEAGEMPEILYLFQRDIVRWAVRMGRAAIFADCGLGKTMMQLAWANEAVLETSLPALVLAPPAVASQTVAEGTKIGVHVNRCRDGSDVHPGINVTNYERLHLFDDIEFGAVVLDESSILKSYTGSTRTALIRRFEDTPYRLACTATPAPNDHAELGNHAEFLGVMSRVEMLSMFFVHDGGSVQNWRLKGHARKDFWQWICEWAAVLRMPSDLGYESGGFELPPLSVTVDEVDCQPINRDTLFEDAATMSLHERRAVRRGSLSERVKCVAEMVNASDEPWVVWCNLNDEGDGLEAAIPDAVQVTGSMSLEAKEDALDAFSRGAHRVIVTKPRIGGFGLNWQHASQVAFCGLSDSYEEYYQAVRRCWRFGQQRPVEAHIVISPAEQIVARNVMAKEARATELASEVAAPTRDSVSASLRGARQTKDTYMTDTESGDGWELRLGDSVEILRDVDSDSVGYSIFSPPFASLYTYSASERDMGNCAGQPEFFEHFAYLVRELYRVTAPGRNLSFHCMNLPTSKVKDGVIGLRDFRGELIRAFSDEGWIYHSEVAIWKNPVTAMQRTKALGLLHKQIKKDSCMSRQGIADYVVTMRKPGENVDPVTHTNETFPVSQWQEYASPVWMDIDAGDTLQARSARQEEDERHICPLQLGVIRRCLRLWSLPGDLVLSPFAGIGSEGYVALGYGRKFLGVELKRSYFDQAAKNLRKAEFDARQVPLFE